MNFINQYTMANLRESERENSFLTQLESARSELRDKFSLAHRLLQEREEAMLLELKGIEDSYREQVQRQTQQKKELLATKEQLYSSLKGNENRDILQTLLAPLETKLRELEEVGELFQRIELSWNEEEQLRDLLKELGIIELKKIELDYTKKTMPVLVACKCRNNSNGPGEFDYPTVIAINSKTNNIYIADAPNHRVQVFDQFCNFIFSFCKNMYTPAGISFHNDYIYVTQYGGNTLNIYTANGDFIVSLGCRGNKELQFNFPFGICIPEYRDNIYICDRENNRVQVLNIDLSFNSFITGLIRPKDVKVTTEEIFVFDNSNPCIHVYNYEHQLTREIISYGNENCQVSSSYHFYIDLNSNILITDYETCCVLIFSTKGMLIHSFGHPGKNPGEFTDPTGIAVDAEDRIIVVSSNPNNCIQLF